MAIAVRFEPVSLAGQYEAEKACLVFASDHLVAVLVRLDAGDLVAERHGWCLEIGFGPCRGEGILFPDLESAESWIRAQVPTGWPSPPPGERSSELSPFTSNLH